MGFSVVIVDDFPSTRAGLRALIESDASFEVVGEAADGNAALDLAMRVSPRVVVLDLGIPGLPGTELIGRLVKSVNARVLVQTMQSDDDTVVRCLREGASGYILKSDPPTTLVEALRAVVAGRTFVSPAFSQEALETAARRLRHGVDGLATLSLREYQVLVCAAEGLTAREAGERLGISSRTVESHRHSVMLKLGFRSHRELVRYAFQRGLVT